MERTAEQWADWIEAGNSEAIDRLFKELKTVTPHTRPTSKQMKVLKICLQNTIVSWECSDVPTPYSLLELWDERCNGVYSELKRHRLDWNGACFLGGVVAGMFANSFKRANAAETRKQCDLVFERIFGRNWGGVAE